MPKVKKKPAPAKKNAEKKGAAPDSCHIVLVLDASSSMASIQAEVVAGVDGFVAEQKKTPGDCTMTLVQFDSQEPYKVLVDAKPVAEVPSIKETYTPRAMTPLYDAMGKAILDLDGKIKAMKATPGKIVFVTMTDGEENCSREFSRDKVAALTKEREAMGWKFIYLGANQDAMMVGHSIGTQVSNSATYTTQNTVATMAMTSAKLSAFRSSGDVSTLDYSAQDREDLTK